MNTNKMTPAPWECSLDVVHSLNNDEAGTIWRSSELGAEIGSTLIAVTSKSPGYEEGKSNATAIVTAVNNTYGAGINPKAVADMLEALKEAKRMYESVQPAGGWQGVYESIKSAINDAKI